MTIKRIGILSAGKVMAMLYALMIFIFGAVFVCISVVAGMIGAVATESGEVMAVTMFGNVFIALGFMVLGPIVYGLLAGLMGMLMAFFYNMVASMVGGLKVDIE